MIIFLLLSNQNHLEKAFVSRLCYSRNIKQARILFLNTKASVMDPYYLIYDWNCELCVNLMKFLKRLDHKNMIVFLPFDDPFAKELGRNMKEEDFQGSFHFIMPNGQFFSGDEAIPYIIGALPGGKVPQWILLHSPGRKFLLKGFYRWLLKIRG